MPEEVRAFGVSALVSVLWLGLVVLETFVLAMSSWFFIPHFFLTLSALTFFTLDPFFSSSMMQMFVLSFLIPVQFCPRMFSCVGDLRAFLAFSVPCQ